MESCSLSAEAPDRSGCLKIGCLAVSVVAFAVILVFIYLFTRSYENYVDNFTDDKPAELPVGALSSKKQEHLQSLLSSAEKSLLNHRPYTFKLTQQEINYLIQTASDLEYLRDILRVEIENGKLSSQISFPLKPLGINGRFLNCRASLKISLANQNPTVKIKAAEVNKQKLPPHFMKLMQKQDFLKGFKLKSKLAPLLTRLGQVRIRKDYIELHFRGD